MFYSHQLLARKAPLGQIWMAATMHAKMNRRKLDQIDIIRICEEILNPSVPMALRLSGILMGGVVIVYERKVRLLYDDVNRLLVEINSAWKVKPAVDPTVLPKGKVQAKFNVVTLPENQSADFGDVEPSFDISAKHTAMGFQQNGYFAMRLDTIDELTESYMESLKEKEPNNQHHQADADNITLDDHLESFQAGPASYNRYERFDIEGDEETQFYFPSQEHTQKPSTPVHSPPPEMQPQRDDILEPEEGKHSHQSSAKQGDTEQKAREDLQKRRFARKRARRQPPFVMDDEQTTVPSNLYQTWLQDTTDIWGRRPKIGERVSPKTSMKLSKLIELPPVALSCGLVSKDLSIYYPPPLLQLWIRSIQPHHDSPSGKSTSPRAPAPSSSSSQEQTLSRNQFQDLPEFPLAGFDNGDPTERLRNDLRNLNEGPAPEFNLSTEPKAPGSAGTEMRSLSIPSPGPGLDYISNTSDSHSGQFSKKRPSSSRFQGSGLGPVDEEEEQWIHERAENNLSLLGEQPERNFKIPRFSRRGLTPDQELLVETGTNTQTQHHVPDEEAEMMTNNIRTHLKTYFETPGAPENESLNQLAFGLNKKQAAQLFYQICVLATRDVLKVHQNLAYGDITIRKGAKM